MTQLNDRTLELSVRVRELMANTFAMDSDELDDDVSQETCSRWTSLYHMMLLVVLEDEFSVSFSTDEMPAMTSLPKIVATLESHGVSL
jgi:acyl carrier protein